MFGKLCVTTDDLCWTQLQADEEEMDDLKIKIQTAIQALNDPSSPMSI